MAASAARAEPIDEVVSQDIGPGAVAAKNAEIIRRHHALLDAGDIAGAVMTFAEYTRNHGVPVGRKGVLRVLTDIHTTFPDWTMKIENLAAIDDAVIVRMIVTGAHKGVGSIPRSMAACWSACRPPARASRSSTSTGTRSRTG
jgi:predicted SnoaL-like aldol condensation-catalyzing enzyme